MKNARVSLQDGTKLKGRIAEIGEDYFVLVEKKTANSNRISFAQVKQVKPVVDNPLGDPAVVRGPRLASHDYRFGGPGEGTVKER